MIDLHMHSKASDGTDDIEGLLEKLRNAEISTFSVTYHDTIEGAMEMESIVSADMHFILGIEFSCISPAGKCHILGYGFDWNKRKFKERKQGITGIKHSERKTLDNACFGSKYYEQG